MWVLLNDAMFSIVESQTDPKTLAVRARFKGDLEKVFGVAKKKVIVDGGTDYKYRVFLPRERVAATIAGEVREINYTNFKDSVGETWLAKLYSRVWSLFYNEQEDRNPLKHSWYKNYRDYSHYATYAGPKSAVASAQVFEENEDRIRDAAEIEDLVDIYEEASGRDAHAEFLARYDGFSSVR